MKTVFVGGIHGVGKTTFCSEFARECEFLHLTASQLIESQKRSAVSGPQKIVRDLDENQGHLVNGLNAFRSHEGFVLLDGHFTLLNESNVVPIPEGVFREISPVLLVVLKGDVQKIIARRLQRDSEKCDPVRITEHQEKEIAHAKSLAASLGVRLHVHDLDNDKRPDIYVALRDFLGC
jgi:adenylate kinase